MARSRLSLAVENGSLILPEAGRIAVFNPGRMADLSALAKEQTHAIQTIFPDHAALVKQGYAADTEPHGAYAAAVVFLPRAKEQARALLAEAAAVTGGGLVIVDGQKTDGIEAMLKATKARTTLEGVLSKAHGKLFWFTGGDFSDWVAQDRKVAGGFITRPGVFSADGPDKGSEALRAALPDKLKGRGVDLGAGWGFLARDILRRDTVTGLDLIEADKIALDCARRNISDARAAFHWADATRFGPGEGYDFVVSNPPFHTGRKGDMDLGRAFISAAAAMLAPNGHFWLVANRHLPYEASLNALFRHVTEAGGNAEFGARFGANFGTGFKVLHAIKPRRKPLDMP